MMLRLPGLLERSATSELQRNVIYINSIACEDIDRDPRSSIIKRWHRISTDESFLRESNSVITFFSEHYCVRATSHFKIASASSVNIIAMYNVFCSLHMNLYRRNHVHAYRHENDV